MPTDSNSMEPALDQEVAQTDRRALIRNAAAAAVVLGSFSPSVQAATSTAALSGSACPPSCMVACDGTAPGGNLSFVITNTSTCAQTYTWLVHLIIGVAPPACPCDPGACVGVVTIPSGQALQVVVPGGTLCTAAGQTWDVNVQVCGDQSTECKCFIVLP